MKYILPKLNYSYEDLEPYIDRQTMEIHYTKHHLGYIDKLNAVLDKYPKIADRNLEDLMKNLMNLDMDEIDRTILKNNGGGHLNHTLFWEIMGKEKDIDEDLVMGIKDSFGSIEEFKEIFSNTAVSRFGSGWAWLVTDPDGKLEVCSLPNQDSPYLTGHTPIIGLDVWEHAYYLKYQNRRAEYVKNWWNVLKLF